jgi:hypothetical protein
VPKRTGAGELDHVNCASKRRPDYTQASPLLKVIDLFGIGKKEAMEPPRRETAGGFSGFLIASLFDCNLLLGMEPQPHTFHPSKHPKET